MEPQRRGSVPPLHSRKRNRTSGLSKTTLEVGVHLQPVGLNAETKKDRHRADGKRCLLTFPYIGLVRVTLPAQPVDATPPSQLIRQHFGIGESLCPAVTDQTLARMVFRLIQRSRTTLSH